MKKTTFHIFGAAALAIAVIVGLTGPVWAQDAKAAAPAKLLLTDHEIPGLDKKIFFDTRGAMDIIQFVDVLNTGFKANLNVIIAPQVAGTVRLTLKDVTIGDAFVIALAANNLAYEVKGTGVRAIINIMTDNEYRIQHGVGFYEQREVKVIDLKFAQPSRVNKMLAGVSSSIGKIIFDDVSGTLVLIDTPEKIAEMESVIARAELPTIARQIPTESRVFTLQYADVADVETQIRGMLTTEAGSMTVNARTRTVIVRDLAHIMEDVEKLIKAFDEKPMQVALSAKIVEVELSDEFSLGVNWSHILNGLGPRFKIATDIPLSGAAGPSINYKTIVAGGDLSLVIDALKTVGDTKVISNPHISVIDGEEATIKVVRNQPYREIAYESGTTNVIGVSYQFVEIGTILSVTPKVNQDSFISVAIKPTISDLIDWYDAPAGNEGVVGIPVVKESEATTSVVVHDGVTIIIGGMIKTEKRDTQIGIPILRAIPIIGALFRSTVQKQAKSETIVFLTPRIISGEEPFMQHIDMDKKMKYRKGGKPEGKVFKNAVSSRGKGQ